MVDYYANSIHNLEAFTRTVCMLFCVCVCDYRCVFTGTWTIHEGCECRKNGKVQHSYFRLQKFAKLVQGQQGFVNCSRESFLVRREFKKSLKFLANVSSIPRTIDNASEPPRMFGELLEPKIWMLDFAIFSTFASFANCLRFPVNTPFLIHVHVCVLYCFACVCSDLYLWQIHWFLGTEKQVPNYNNGFHKFKYPYSSRGRLDR